MEASHRVRELKKTPRNLLVLITALSLVIVIFFPLLGVDANFQLYSNVTKVEGNQTWTITGVSLPPPYNAMASISYCLVGYGALLQNGTYNPLVVSHLGLFCSTPQP